MHQFYFFRKKLSLLLAAALLAVPGARLRAETTPTLQIKADHVSAQTSPRLYGLMTEEINYSYEGGLYGELIRNRTFQTDKNGDILFWSKTGTVSLSKDAAAPFNDALGASLKMDLSNATKDSPAGIVNGGYWGIPAKSKTTYLFSFYAKADKTFNGPLTVTLQSADGEKIFATAKIAKLGTDWKKYEVTLKTKKITPSKDNVIKLTATTPGTVWLQQVSLFPPTYNDRANGNRPDLMQLMADMQPKFLRFPGGNYLEGDYINERFDWKKTIGPVEQRAGHRSPWNYWSTDGLGLMEFLYWCEDLKMEPVLAVFAGYALKRDYIKPGPDLEPYVQDALDEIEYVTGNTNTTWGARRAADGHPEPFPLRYIEIGNEDWFDRSGSYDGRFTQFYDAIKAKYPGLQLISSVGYEHPKSQLVHSRNPDLVDEHYYRSQEEMEAHALDYDKYSRTNQTKIFVGEWATRVGSPTPNMAGALGDAAWMTGMERNSDIVLMHCYAPLFVNVSDLKRGGSMQWPSDLIGYDALNSYGSPSYYAQKMFSTRHGDQILATEATDVPTYEWQPPAKKRSGVEQPLAPKQQIRKFFSSVTRDSRTGTIFVKLVNSLGTPQPVNIQISGVGAVAAKGTATVLKAEKLDDTNSILEPEKIIPVTEKVKGLGKTFTRTLPPYSITILELETK